MLLFLFNKRIAKKAAQKLNGLWIRYLSKTVSTNQQKKFRIIFLKLNESQSCQAESVSFEHLLKGPKNPASVLFVLSLSILWYETLPGGLR